MKNIKIIFTFLLLFTMILQSCEDIEEVNVPNFEVIPSTLTAKVGVPIEFNISNSPDFLNFYSGEFGHEYKNRDRTKAEGTFSLSFDSSQHWQNGTSLTTQSSSVQVSTDYDGSGTPAGIAAATWTDISDRFTLATARSYTYTNSGIADISDLASSGKPIYFAFKILAHGKTSEGNRQGEWRFDNFDVNLAVTGETYSLNTANMDTPGWKPVNVAGVNSHSSYDNFHLKNGYYRMLGQRAEYTNEDWLISNPINLSGAVSPDRGKALKTYTEKLRTFTHTYSEVGTYKVTLVGNNTTVNGNAQKIKEFTITVEN